MNALHLLAELALDDDDLPAAAERLRDANDLLAVVDRELPHHLLLVGEIARRSGRRAEADALASAALSRMGDDEVLFPGRRRFLPPDAVRGPHLRRATLLTMTADVIAGAIAR